MMKELNQWLTQHQTEMLAELEELVNLESPSDRKDLLDTFSETLASKFKALGAKTTVIPQAKAGNHLKVEFGEGDSQVLLLCHFDTVFSAGTTATRPYRFDPTSGKATGPGVLDMKAGIIASLWAMKAFKALKIQPKVKVVILFNSDEEVGSITSRAPIEAEAKQSKTVFVLEPGTGPKGAYKIWRKGTGGFTVKITGKASHAGSNPEEGISAIDELSYVIQKIHAFNNPITGTTLNVGVVSGGTRGNVVAEEAYAKVDIRVMTLAEGEKVVPQILAIQPVGKAKVEITGGLNRPPMEKNPKAVALYEKANAFAQEVGFSYEPSGTGGGSDGNFTAALGVTTLDGMGGVGHGAHSSDEYLFVNQLPVRTAILAELIRTLE